MVVGIATFLGGLGKDSVMLARYLKEESPGLLWAWRRTGSICFRFKVRKKRELIVVLPYRLFWNLIL